MRFKSVDIDRMDGDNPESMSRTSKIQRRVASSLIRPTSASTGEQRQRWMILKSIPPPYVSYRH